MKNKVRLIFKRSLPVSVITLFVWLNFGCFSNQTSDPNRLVKGTPVTRKIINDEIHSYTVALEKDQYLELAVEQRDVDVITKVFAPGGELIGEFDTPTSGRGTEKIRFGTDAAGEYRVEIYTLSERAEPGEYKLEFAEFRPVTARDRQTLAAVKLHQQADILRSKPESIRDSIPVYEKALAVWRELGEKPDEGNTLRAMGFAFQRAGELEKAKEHFGKALEIWQETGDTRSAAFTHVIFGVIAKKQNHLEMGLKEDLLAQTLWEQASDLPESAQNLVRIGNDYAKLGKKEEALDYFEKAMQASRRVERKSVRAYVLSSYGDAKAEFGDNAAALNFYRESLDIWKSLEQEKAAANLQEKIEKLNVR